MLSGEHRAIVAPWGLVYVVVEVFDPGLDATSSHVKCVCPTTEDLLAKWSGSRVWFYFYFQLYLLILDILSS